MTESGYHNLEPYKIALKEMGFETWEDLLKANRNIPLDVQKRTLDSESDEVKRMLLTNIHNYLSMGEHGRGS